MVEQTKPCSVNYVPLEMVEEAVNAQPWNGFRFRIYQFIRRHCLLLYAIFFMFPAIFFLGNVSKPFTLVYFWPALFSIFIAVRLDRHFVPLADDQIDLAVKLYRSFNGLEERQPRKWWHGGINGPKAGGGPGIISKRVLGQLGVMFVIFMMLHAGLFYADISYATRTLCQRLLILVPSFIGAFFFSYKGTLDFGYYFSEPLISPLSTPVKASRWKPIRGKMYGFHSPLVTPYNMAGTAGYILLIAMMVFVFLLLAIIPIEVFADRGDNGAGPLTIWSYLHASAICIGGAVFASSSFGISSIFVGVLKYSAVSHKVLALKSQSFLVVNPASRTKQKPLPIQ